jgi:hypothetical protein
MRFRAIRGSLCELPFHAKCFLAEADPYQPGNHFDHLFHFGFSARWFGGLQDSGSRLLHILESRLVRLFCLYRLEIPFQ